MSVTMQNIQAGDQAQPDGFRKGRSWLTKLVSFCDNLENDREAVDVVCLDFSKAFHTFLTTFSWRNWLLMTRMGVLFAG